MGIEGGLCCKSWARCHGASNPDATEFGRNVGAVVLLPMIRRVDLPLSAY